MQPLDPYPRRRGSAALLLALPLLIAPAVGAVWARNSMLGHAETVRAAWAQVESNLQRRADLVPRLVEVVQRAMSHEAQVLEDVTRQRTSPALAVQEALGELARAQSASVQGRTALAGAPPDDPAQLAALLESEAAVGRGVQVVLAVAESYPSLRSSDQLLELQAQLEGSENRINASRMAFNAAVRDYNAALVQLPTSLFAAGLERRPYFRASEGSRVAMPLGLD